MDELKPCPFCGGKSVVFCLSNMISIEIRCESCRIVMSNKYVPDLKTAWNTRSQASVPSLEALDSDKLAELIMDINFDAYGFSHEEVAHKTAKAICERFGR